MPTNRVLLIEPAPGPAAVAAAANRDATSTSDVASALSKVRTRKYSLTCASTLADGTAGIVNHPKTSAVLLDLNLPDSKGLSTFLRFQSKAGTAPILILVNRDDEELALEAVKRGALDYLIRDEVTSSLLDKALRLAFERTHTVLALRASEARFRTMFESNAAGVYQASCDDRLITVNPAFIRMLGYDSESQVLALDVSRDIFASAEDHAAWRRDLEEEDEVTSRETTLRDKTGNSLVVMHNARLIRDSRGAPLYYEGTLTDITAAHSQARQWSYEASHDALTSLLNRRELERRLHAILENARIDRSTLAALMIDLDGFKGINDKFGHGAGDDVLRHVAAALRHSARGGDLIARLGGDEFVMVLVHCAESEATKIGENILAALRSEPCLWAGQTLPVRASIGIALSDLASATSWSDLLEHADLACYDAKGRGGNRVQPYRDDGTAIVRLSKARRFALAIEHALDTSTLRLAARPIVPLQDPNGFAHCELLARLPRAAGEAGKEGIAGVVPDLARIAAQQPALAQRIDRWAIQTSLRWIAKHHRAEGSTARWFVNLSSASLDDSTLPPYVAEQLKATRAPVARIGFEIAETALTEHFTAACDLLTRLHAMHLESTLDGFGRGVSSFAYLKALPVNYVKIDWTALADTRDTDSAIALLKSLHQINRTLRRRTIVQSLNTPELVGPITALGIDYAQGTAVGTRSQLARRPAKLQ